MSERAQSFELTSLTDCGGCAAKLAPDMLQGLLERIGGDRLPPQMLVALDRPDDAAAYEISPGIAVLATVDFFPPIVDSPFVYGSIAAANALSDVFAMGGRVLFALNIAAVPESLAEDVLHEILAGGMAVVRAAGGIIAGGHTIRDREPKYGLAVVGVADSAALMLKRRARPGDVLILTKPLGTGLIVSGRRQKLAADSDLEAAINSMVQLNKGAAEVFVRSGVRAATDVTGFGLLGHALEMALASRVRVVINASSLPALPGALELARAGVRTGGSKHNRRFLQHRLRRTDSIEVDREALAFDPQTSGGLLASIPSPDVDAVEHKLREAGENFWRVGRVEEGSGVDLEP